MASHPAFHAGPKDQNQVVTLVRQAQYRGTELTYHGTHLGIREQLAGIGSFYHVDPRERELNSGLQTWQQAA